MSSSNIYSNYAYSKNNTGLRNEVQKMRRKLQEMQWRQEREQQLKEEEDRKALELEKFRKAEAERQEIEKKTKRYFAFDHYNRKKLVKDRSYYFGDYELKNGSWRPDGKGQFIDQEDKILEGEFRKGDYRGGTVYFRSTEQLWSGAVRHDVIQGNGTMLTKTYREKTAKDIIFGDDHLEPGSFNPSSSNNSVASGKSNRSNASMHQEHKHRRDVEQDTDQPDSPRRKERKELEEKHKQMVEIVHSDEVLAFNGQIMCKKAELQPGTRIEFFDDQYARVGISDSTQLSTTNLSPPRYTRNSAVHRIEAIRSQAEKQEAIQNSLPVLKMHRVPGPYAPPSSNSTDMSFQSSSLFPSLTEDTYERNLGPPHLNAMDRGHFSLQATIIEHRRGWKYLVRLDDEVYPRDRILDFQHLGRLRILREQPRIFHLHSFPAVFSNHPQNNSPYHRTDTHNNYKNQHLHNHSVASVTGNNSVSTFDDASSSFFHSEASQSYSSTVSYNAPTGRVVAHPDHPRHTTDFREHLPQHQVTTRPLLPVVPSRSSHAKRTNYFETALIGYGATQEEEEAKEKLKLQRLQWKRFIEDKKKAFEAERQRQIEEEQAKQLQNSVAQAVVEKLAQEQQDAEDDEMTRRSALTSVYSEFGEDDENEDNENINDKRDVQKQAEQPRRKGKKEMYIKIDTDDLASGKSSLSTNSSLVARHH